jgi:hypothetical protein
VCSVGFPFVLCVVLCFPWSYVQCWFFLGALYSVGFLLVLLINSVGFPLVLLINSVGFLLCSVYCSFSIGPMYSVGFPLVLLNSVGFPWFYLIVLVSNQYANKIYEYTRPTTCL